MSTDTVFKTELAAAAEASVARQSHSAQSALRQAFFDGVQFEMERRRREVNTIPESAE